MNTEQSVVRELVARLSQIGWDLVAVNDGEEVVKYTDVNRADAFDLIFDLSDVTVTFKKGFNRKSILFIFGNAPNGCEVVADYTMDRDECSEWNTFLDSFTDEQISKSNV